MSYRFIIGSAGSGKTRTAFWECINGDLHNRYIIIVPEQSTMITQKQIVDMHPNHATTNIDVQSFNRLAYRIFQEMGMEHPEAIDDISKALIVKRVALARKQDLRNYKNLLNKSGFISELKSIISEFYQYGIRTTDLHAALQQDLRPHLRDKLHDTSLIYEGFQDFIREKFITTEEILDLLCKVLPNSAILKDAYIVLDGFTGFTPIQLRIIEVFLMHARQVTITMNCDSLEEAYAAINDSDLFLLSKKAIQKITKLASMHRILHLDDIFLQREGGNAALNHLERHFLRFDAFLPVSCEEAIRITRLSGMDEEIRFVTSNILRLVQSGMRYKEIAIVTRDLGHYKEALVQRMQKLGIPLFVDESISIANNPLIEFIRFALRLCSEALCAEHVLQYLKVRPDTDEERVWAMELYFKACGMHSKKKLLSDWYYVPKELEGVDLPDLMMLRDEVLEETQALAKAFSHKNIHAGEVVNALSALLESFSFEERMLAMSKEFGADAKKSREYADIYAQTQSVLLRIAEILKDEELEKADFLEIFESGVAEIRVGMIPASIDKIVLGDLIRTRLGDIKALFILGANEGTLISAKSQNAILNDKDKEVLGQMGISLSTTILEDIFIQRYYLYLMFTKATQNVFITYAGRDRAGNALKEASVVAQVKRLYTDLDIEYAEGIGEIYSKEEAKERLILAMRDFCGEEAQIRELLPYVDMVDMLIAAATYRYSDSKLSKEAANLLYGMEIIAGATRLEQFVDCPYKHFLRYGLGIKEEAEYRLENMDIGTLAHGIIEKCFVLAKREKMDIIHMSDAKVDALVKRCLELSKMEDEKGIFEESFKNKYMVERIANMAKRIVKVLQIQLAAGEFRPEYFEKAFLAKDDLHSLQFFLGEDRKLLLTGKIDRVDIANWEDRILLKIIDYKTGSTKWETDLAFYGKQLQLILYLSAMKEFLQATNQKEIVPAAFFYMRLDDPMIDVNGILGEMPDEALQQFVEQELVKTLRPSGVVQANVNIIKMLDKGIEEKSSIIPVTLKNGSIADSGSSVASGENIRRLEEFVRKKVVKIGREMMDGRISVLPGKRKEHTACTYCPYLSVCGFDKKTKGYRYKNMPSLKNADAWEKIISDAMDDTEETEDESLLGKEQTDAME